MTYTAKYEVPVTARLLVDVPVTGTRVATDDDLKKFDLVRSLDAYMAVDTALVKAMRTRADTSIERDKHITRCHVNPFRYLAELAIRYGHLPEVGLPVDDETLEDVAVIERTLALVAEGRGDDASELYRTHLAKREAELEGGSES